MPPGHDDAKEGKGMADKLTLYDILGSLLPGVLLLGVINVLFPGAGDPFPMPAVPDTAKAALLTAEAILAGMTVELIGNLWEAFFLGKIQPYKWALAEPSRSVQGDQSEPPATIRSPPENFIAAAPMDGHAAAVTKARSVFVLRRTRLRSAKLRVAARLCGHDVLPVETANRVRAKLVAATGTEDSLSLFLYAVTRAEGTEGKARIFNALLTTSRSLTVLCATATVLCFISVLKGHGLNVRMLIGSFLLTILFGLGTLRRSAYHVREVLLAAELALDQKAPATAGSLTTAALLVRGYPRSLLPRTNRNVMRATTVKAREGAD